MIDLLQTYTLNPCALTTIQHQELTRLLAELAIEQLKQNQQSIDYRSITSFKSAYTQALGAERMATYQTIIRAEWEKIRQRYQETGKLTIELPLYTVTPLLLNPITEQPAQNWAIKPSDNQSILRCYDIEAEQQAKETQQQINSDPYTHISVGHLRAFNWDAMIYAKNPEQPYKSFQGFIEERLNDFKATHGGQLTPVLIFKVSDRLMQTVGGDLLLCGWRVTIKTLAPPPTTEQQQPTEQPVPKKSLLDRLTSLL